VDERDRDRTHDSQYSIAICLVGSAVMASMNTAC
jgi:hypothetical protein